MAGLSNALAIAVGALQAEQGALNITTNNVANTNTPGYSRQVPDLVENSPIVLGNLTVGAGVDLQKIESLRDSILQVQIGQETQQQGQLNSFVTALQQAQTLFTSSTADIGTQISNFFSSLAQLSTDPANLALRQGVLTAAGNLANAFNNTADNLSQQKTNLDLSVAENVQQVNTLTTQIAGLNTQIANLENIHHDASAFVDQRDVLIGQLSNLIDVSIIHSDNTITLTTSNGTALVAGEQSFALSTQTVSSGVEDIFAQGKDITGAITSGSLGGLIQVRDQTIPNLLLNLDTLAAGLANGLNAAHAAGYDLKGNAGQNLFIPPPISGQGAAASLAVAITDPALVAASSDGNPGSNGNVAALSAVAAQPVAQLATPNLNEQDGPGGLSSGDVLAVGGQTSVTAGGVTFTYTAGSTSGANLNQVTGDVTTLSPATVLTAGDVVTATRGHGLTTTYTAGNGATVADLIKAIDLGVSSSAVTVGGTDSLHTGYQGGLVGGALQVVDLHGDSNLAVTETVDSVVSSGAPFTPNAAATSTVQDLINAINNDTTAGAKAALVGGKLEITDPQKRGNLAVTTTDTLLGAALAGAPSVFATPNVSTGQTPTQYYSNIVFGVGNDVANATAELTASQLVLQQLQDQRGSISGVSLDEEAANMVLYQRAYDAAAQTVTTINDMLYTVINMGTLTG